MSLREEQTRQAMVDKPDQLLTAMEVALRLHSTYRTVRRWLIAGRLQGNKTEGGKRLWLVSERDLAWFIAELQLHGTTQERRRLMRHPPACLDVRLRRDEQ